MKPNKPDSFSGTAKEKVDLWLFEMEQYFDATGLAENRKVAFAASFLHGAAATWWRSHVIQSNNSTSGITRIVEWSQFYFDIKSSVQACKFTKDCT